MELTMRIEALKAAIVDWFVDAVMPSLKWGERIVISLKMPVIAKEACDKAEEILREAGLVSDDNEVDVDEALKRIREYAFRNVKHIDVMIGDTEIRIKMENLEEIARAARGDR